MANCIKRHIIPFEKFEIKARFTYINKIQSDFAISRGFNFHEASHMQSFAKIKSSRKFLNLQKLKVGLDHLFSSADLASIVNLFDQAILLTRLCKHTG